MTQENPKTAQESSRHTAKTAQGGPKVLAPPLPRVPEGKQSRGKQRRAEGEKQPRGESFDGEDCELTRAPIITQRDSKGNVNVEGKVRPPLRRSSCAESGRGKSLRPNTPL